MAQNAIHIMQSLIASEDGQEYMARAIANELSCIVEGKPLSRVQLRRYLEWVRDGLLLAQNLLGERAVPPVIYFTERLLNENLGPGFVGYVPELDAIVIHFVRIVNNAFVSGPDELVCHEHCGLDGMMSARMNVMLMMLEECFHYHDICVVGSPVPMSTRYTAHDDPLEIKWRAYRDELVVRS